MLTIINKESKLVKFNTVHPYETFKYQGEYYVKLSTAVCRYNTFCYNTNQLGDLSMNTLVEIVQLKLTEEE